MKISTKNISLYALMVLIAISFATLSLTGCGSNGNNTGVSGTGKVTFIDSLPTLTGDQSWRLYVVPNSATEIKTSTQPVAIGLSSNANYVNRSVSLRKVISGSIGSNQSSGDWNETGDYHVVITIVEGITIRTWKVLSNVAFTNGNADILYNDFVQLNRIVFNDEFPQFGYQSNENYICIVDGSITSIYDSSPIIASSRQGPPSSDINTNDKSIRLMQGHLSNAGVFWPYFEYSSSDWQGTGSHTVILRTGYNRYSFIPEVNFVFGGANISMSQLLRFGEITWTDNPPEELPSDREWFLFAVPNDNTNITVNTKVFALWRSSFTIDVSDNPNIIYLADAAETVISESGSTFSIWGASGLYTLVLAETNTGVNHTFTTFLVNRNVEFYYGRASVALSDFIEQN